jgi:hypothetical protein
LRFEPSRFARAITRAATRRPIRSPSFTSLE